MAVKKKAAKKKSVKKKTPPKKKEVVEQEDAMTGIQPENPEYWSKEHVAKILGVSTRIISTLQARDNDPLPIAIKGGGGVRKLSNYYDPKDVTEWIVRYRIAQQFDFAPGEEPEGGAISYERERARLMREQADGQALKNSVTRGTLVPESVISAATDKVAKGIRSILGGIKLQVKKQLPHLSTQELDIINKEIIKAQNAASEFKIDTAGLADDITESDI